MITGEIIIQRYDKQYGWCLEQLVNEQNAESEKQKLETKFPNVQFRIKRIPQEEAANAWWNKDLD